jgi:acyl-coenzyme A synthetase/AMP-(fatty) acid ligase
MEIINTSDYSVGSINQRSLEVDYVELVEPSPREILEEFARPSNFGIKYVILRPDSTYPSAVLGDNSMRLDGSRTPGIWIGLFTSGTTGSPVLHLHSIESLKSATKFPHPGKVWGLLYPGSRMAGIQVILQAWANGVNLIDPHRTNDPQELIEGFVDSGVDCLSATPSRLRLLMSLPNFRKLNLRYISLGGEIADQKLLNNLSEIFPTSEVRHIYATTETGPIFSISDGREGFPEDLLSRTLSSGKRLEIDGDELLVSWLDEATQAESKIRTGDVVHRSAGRIVFLGRRGDVANVGGVKVSLAQVEQFCRLVPGVIDAQAKSQPNPFLGSVITVELLWENTPLEDNYIREILLNHLPKHGIPAVMNHVQRINLSDNFKKMRNR